MIGGMTRHLGDVLRELREDADLSQNALARESGVSVSLVNRIEQHVHHTMTPDNLALIAQRLGVSVDDIRAAVGDSDGRAVNEYSLEEWLERDGQLTADQRAIVMGVYRGLARPGR